MSLYLDYNASAPILKDSADAIIDCLKTVGNPSSVHRSGRKARSIIENSRKKIASMIGANAQNIIFTSGATEANCLALNASCKMTAIVSSIEHPSVLSQRNDAILIPVNKSGVVSLEELEKILYNSQSKKMFISVMSVNNETGVIQPIKEIINLCRKYNTIIHVDAVQAIGRIPIKMNESLEESKIDLLTISSHKIGGPKGVGCLIYNENLEHLLMPFMKGGGQERGKRAGTEALELIAGFGAAAEYANNFFINDTKKSRDLLEHLCIESCSNASIIGYDSPRVSNTSSIAFEGLEAESIVIALDLAGYEVSSGSACSSGKVSTSHVLKAMGYGNSILKSSIRISLCSALEEDVIKKFVGTISSVVSKLENIKGINS